MEKTDIQDVNSVAEELTNNVHDETLPPNPVDILVKEEPEIGEVIRKSPDVERVLRKHPEISGRLLGVTQTRFSGPIPPPQLLKGYEDIMPGSAREIFDMAKDQAAHERSFENKALGAQMRDNLLGQVFGFLIGTIAILAGTYAAVNGAQLSGGLIGGGGVAALTAVFVLGRRPKNSDKSE